jgi:hypothetical protein
MMQQQVMVVKPARPYPVIVENKSLMVFILLGLVFLLIGSMMVNYAPEIINHKDYSGASDPTKARENDNRLYQSILDFGSIFKTLGVFFVVGFLLLAAILRNDLSDYTRFGILLVIGLLMFGSRFTLP